MIEVPRWVGPALAVLGGAFVLGLLSLVVCPGPSPARTADAIKAYLGQQLQAEAALNATPGSALAEVRQKALEYHETKRFEDVSLRPITAGSLLGADEFYVQVAVVSGERRALRYFIVQDAGCFRQPRVIRETTALKWSLPVL